MKHCLFLLMTLSTLTAGAAEIQLRAAAQPTGALLLLGDVAEVFARDAAQAEELKQIELFPAPAIGGKRYVRLREVQDVLERRGISLSEHTFSGSSQVAVTAEVEQSAAVLRVSTAHSASEMRRAHRVVQDAVVQHLEAKASAKETWSVEPDLDDNAIRSLLTAGKIDSLTGGQ